MIIRVCHVSDFGLIGGDLSNFLTAVTPRHPGRAGLSNCAKIAPKFGDGSTNQGIIISDGRNRKASTGRRALSKTLRLAPGSLWIRRTSSCQCCLALAGQAQSVQITSTAVPQLDYRSFLYLGPGGLIIQTLVPQRALAASEIVSLE